MNIDELNKKMNFAVTHLEKEFQSLRTSRANPSMLDNLYVDAYGSKTPINQLGNISAPDPGTLTIQIWDVNLIKNIENAILESNLGLNPQTDGSILRLPIPKLSEERRNELAKLASQYGESAKIAIRNIRREVLDEFKKEEKDKKISQDEVKKNSSEVQNITDSYISKIDTIVSNKQAEIIKV